MNKNLDLLLTFMKIGAFTFGGCDILIPLYEVFRHILPQDHIYH